MRLGETFVDYVLNEGRREYTIQRALAPVYPYVARMVGLDEARTGLVRRIGRCTPDGIRNVV